MFASNFTTLDSHTKFLRGEDNLSTYTMTETIGRPNSMTNYFCKTCGSLMFRKGSGFPDMRIMRIGTVVSVYMIRLDMLDLLRGIFLD